MGTTAHHNLPYPELSDTPNVPRDLKLLADAMDRALDVSMPTGAIIMWSGLVSAVPSGWALCDGTAHGSADLQAVLGSANTPDLRDRFVVGAGGKYASKDTGGEEAVTLTAAQSGAPAHGHTASIAATDTNHQHNVAAARVLSDNHDRDHSHGGTTGTMNSNWSHNHGGAVDGRQPTVHVGHSRFGQETGAEVAGSGVQYMTDNSGQGSSTTNPLSVWANQDWHNHGIPASDINHTHSFGTGGASTGHHHWMTIPAQDTSHHLNGTNAAHAHAATVAGAPAVNASQAHNNLPPYFALAFLIKT